MSVSMCVREDECVCERENELMSECEHVCERG